MIPTVNDDGGDDTYGGDDEPGRKVPSRQESTPEERDQWVQDQMPLTGEELEGIADESDPEADAGDITGNADTTEAAEEELAQSLFTPPQDAPQATESPSLATETTPPSGDGAAEAITEESSFEADPAEFAAAFEDYLQANPDEDLPGGVPGPQDETFIPGMPGSEFNDEKFPIGDGLDLRASAEADYRSSQQERSAAELAIFRLLAQDNREHTRMLREILTFLERDRI